LFFVGRVTLIDERGGLQYAVVLRAVQSAQRTVHEVIKEGREVRFVCAQRPRDLNALADDTIFQEAVFEIQSSGFVGLPILPVFPALVPVVEILP
jgi:hypothetical protein